MSDRAFTKMIQSLNGHIPKRRKMLAVLLKEDLPHIEGKDGSIHVFKRDELKKIAEILSEEDYEKILLPIYIELNSDYGRGAGRINGKIDCNLAKSIIKVESKREDELILYADDVRALRKNLPTTTQYIFGMR
ncbi:MAG: hypothetical protein MOIL_00387 [Candidatus Methanolliviera sp. GoM_oil]|nr:MAG: hypothetical protein MOIL_00387 [Candidatus Methanolliviera sp. GoM_oil]